MTKADGTKFGKTESGAVWLTTDRTSAYAFYQFWLNSTDADAPKYIRTFTFLSKEEIEAIEAAHAVDPGLRMLQKRLAKEVTLMVHGQEALDSALKTTAILFDRQATAADFNRLTEREILDGFEGVPQATVSRADFDAGLGIIDALSAKSGFLASNGEARRELKQNAIALNKDKVQDDYVLSETDLICGKFVLLSKGKKNNYLLIVE